MSELKIEIDEIDLANLFGVNNSHFEALKLKFPKLKLIARGNQLKAIGPDDELKKFERLFDSIIKYYNRYNFIEKDTFEQLFENSKLSLVPKKNVIIHGVNGVIVQAKTENQRRIVESIKKNDLLFVVGPAGTGKTYTAIALAVKYLKENQVKKIVLSRPAVEAGESLGFLPGDFKEKLDPYLQPLYDAFKDMLTSQKLKHYVEKEIIEIAPMAFMRGRTLDNAFVILDEAQNTTDLQMKMFLTRMGPNAKFIVTGDSSQIDLPSRQKSGLVSAVKKLKKIKNIDVILLSEKDVLRHKLLKDIIKAYNK